MKNQEKQSRALPLRFGSIKTNNQIQISTCGEGSKQSKYANIETKGQRNCRLSAIEAVEKRN